MKKLSQQQWVAVRKMSTEILCLMLMGRGYDEEVVLGLDRSNLLTQYVCWTFGGGKIRYKKHLGFVIYWKLTKW